MDELTLPAYAKINLSLDVTGKRADGYHFVSMVMQPVSLCDFITVTLTESGVTVTADADGVPDGPENLAYRAAELFFARFGLRCGAEITLEKHIPAAAGLAGGSSDAAAVLHALNRLTGVSAPLSALTELGLKLGADVPFCLYGKPALASGIGEELSPAPVLSGAELLIVNPGFAVSTKEIYEAIDSQPELDHPDNQKLMDALKKGDLKTAVLEMKNVMQPVTAARSDAVVKMIKALFDMGAVHAMMSGSGPTVFGIFHEGAIPKDAAAKFREYGCTAWTADCLAETSSLA